MQLHIIALLPLLAGAHASPINANDARATGTRGDQPPTVPATPFPSMPMPPTTASAAVPASVATPLPLQGISIGVSDYTRVLKVTEYMMPSDLETLYDYEKIKGKKTSVAQALFDKRKTAIDVSGPFVKTFELPPLDEVQYMDGWKELTGDRAMYGLDIEFSIASKDYATQVCHRITAEVGYRLTTVVQDCARQEQYHGRQ